MADRLNTNGGGGVVKPKPLPYVEPKGPKKDGKMTNYGKCGTQGCK